MAQDENITKPRFIRISRITQKKITFFICCVNRMSLNRIWNIYSRHSGADMDRQTEWWSHNPTFSFRKRIRLKICQLSFLYTIFLHRTKHSVSFHSVLVLFTPGGMSCSPTAMTLQWTETRYLKTVVACELNPPFLFFMSVAWDYISERRAPAPLSQCYSVHHKSHKYQPGREPWLLGWEAGDYPPEPWHVSPWLRRGLTPSCKRIIFHLHAMNAEGRGLSCVSAPSAVLSPKLSAGFQRLVLAESIHWKLRL